MVGMAFRFEGYVCRWNLYVAVVSRLPPSFENVFMISESCGIWSSARRLAQAEASALKICDSCFAIESLDALIPKPVLVHACQNL
jgi:hypothetical protein